MVVIYVSRKLKTHECNYPTHDLKRLIELLEDYDCTIKYHPKKTNVLVDALNRKVKTELRAMFTRLSLYNVDAS
ncbi:terpene synthase 10-like [Gossypium australe]|uniref:Terpene synthase 10-like n=1 Tax=Gossypium australe TaxID=47621 RepID=A0A5B6VVJ6_9ROSI|nr:terpene synthase 10-like [Gossypium australe]